MMLMITEAGRAMVSSPEFAERLEQSAMAIAKDLSIPLKIGEYAMVVQIVAALCGKTSPSYFNTTERFEELWQFIDRHLDEINVVVGICECNLKARSTEDQPAN